MPATRSLKAVLSSTEAVCSHPASDRVLLRTPVYFRSTFYFCSDALLFGKGFLFLRAIHGRRCQPPCQRSRPVGSVFLFLLAIHVLSGTPVYFRRTLYFCVSSRDTVLCHLLDSKGRVVDVRLPGKGNSNSHGARPAHLIITTIKWFRTSRLSIKNSLPVACDAECRRR